VKTLRFFLFEWQKAGAGCACFSRHYLP